MRTFIVGVLLAIEYSYNFIELTNLAVRIIIVTVLVVGFFLAVAQDIKELK